MAGMPSFRGQTPIYMSPWWPCREPDPSAGAYAGRVPPSGGSQQFHPPPSSMTLPSKSLRIHEMRLSCACLHLAVCLALPGSACIDGGRAGAMCASLCCVVWGSCLAACGVRGCGGSVWVCVCVEGGVVSPRGGPSAALCTPAFVQNAVVHHSITMGLEPTIPACIPGVTGGRCLIH